MHPEFLKIDPTRRPQWRLDRVMQMILHRPSPLRARRYDDYYVRAYRRFLLEYIAGEKDEERRHEIVEQLPHIYHAHRLHYSPDIELRQIVEAWLLTGASDEDIAHRFGTEPKVIDCFEKLVFNVRDRLQNQGWIHKVIRGPTSMRTPNKNGVVTDDQRGCVYRTFAYYGGPLILDAVISGIGQTTMPQRPEEVAGWLEDALAQLVRSGAAVAEKILALNQQNAIQLMKLAIKLNATETKDRAEGRRTKYEDLARTLLGTIEWKTIDSKLPELDENQKRFMTSAVEPRATEQLELAHGKIPATLEEDLARFDAARINVNKNNG